MAHQEIKTELRKWVKDLNLDPNLSYKNAAYQQFEKIQKFQSIVEGPAYVISSHTSKSVTLPVVLVETDHADFILRDNFHDIKVSVNCPYPCDHDLFGLCAGGDSYLHDVYFEGFEYKWIYPPFIKGMSQFSVSTGWEDLYSLGRLMKWYYLAPKNDKGQRHPRYPDDPLIQTLIRVRETALNCGVPMYYRRADVSGDFHFSSR